MKRSFTRISLLVLILCLLLTACQAAGPASSSDDDRKASRDGSSGAGERKVIRYVNWISAEMATRGMIDHLLAEFMKRNPGIAVENIAVPFAQCPTQLVVMAESGDMPDVVQMTGYWSALLASQDVLEGLDDYVKRDNYIYDSYSQSFMDAAKYQDKLYALPFALTPHGFWYNKQLMKEAGINSPPLTIHELNVQLEAIKRELGNKKVYGIGIDTTTTDYALTGNWPYFWAFGAENLLADSHNPGFKDPSVLETLKWFGFVAKNNYTPIGMEIKIERELMAQNKIVYKLDGPYLKGILQDLNGDLKGERFDEIFGVTTIPTVQGVLPHTIAEIHSLGISTSSKEKEAAWKLMTFLASDNYSVTNYIIPMGMIPPQRSSIQHNKDRLFSPHMNTFLGEIAPYARAIPYSPRLGTAGTHILEGLRDIFGGSDPAEVQKRVDGILSEIYGN